MVGPLARDVGKNEAETSRLAADMRVVREAIVGSEDLPPRVKALQEDVANIDTRLAAMRTAFGELEGQFGRVTDVRNIQSEEVDRRLRMLWRRAYGEDLPGLTYFPKLGKEHADLPGNNGSGK